MLEKLRNYEVCARAFYKIKTKDAALSPFVFNTYQRKLSQIENSLLKENKPVRMIVLKCRQIGCSTWGVGRVYNRASTYKNIKANIIADTIETSTNLFEMSKLFWEESPSSVRPMRKYSNLKRLSFDNPSENGTPGLRSSINILTAGNKKAGRSTTTHLLHCSEFAFWPNAGEVFTGLMSSVPYTKDSFVLIESTANGIAGNGQQFHELWMRACDSGGYTPVFFPFQDNPEYTLPVPHDFKLNQFTRFGDEEWYLKTIPGMTKEHLVWRRWKIDNEMGSALIDPLDQFCQEYPAYAEECFISTGRPVFNNQFLLEKISEVSNVTYTKKDIREIFKVDSKGVLKVFEEPQEKKVYSIGADVAQNVAEGDYSTLFVLDKELTQVASFKGKIDPDIFGVLLCEIGKYYNNAILAPEINNHGFAVVSKIKELKYPRIYKRERQEKIFDERTDLLGWQTNVKTKIKMLDDFVASVRDGTITIKDVELFRELSTLSIEDDGNVVLNSKDLTVSACIALQAIHQAPSGKTGVIFNDSRKEGNINGNLQERFKYYSRMR